MTIYLNSIPVSLDNAKLIMEEQFALMKKIKIHGTLVQHRVHPETNEMALYFISDVKHNDDAPSFTFAYHEEKANCIEWYPPVYNSETNVGDYLEVSDTSVFVMHQHFFYPERVKPEVPAKKPKKMVSEDDLPF